MEMGQALKIVLGDSVLACGEYVTVVSPPKVSRVCGKQIVRIPVTTMMGRTLVLDHNDIDSVVVRPSGVLNNPRVSKKETSGI